MEMQNLAGLRRDYAQRELSESSIDRDPFDHFAIWLTEYIDAKPPEPNAMVLSTVGRDGRPSSRVVLLKGFDHDGFVFFTNYESEKAADIDVNPNVALHFFWPEIERQVSIRGSAQKTSRSESEEYFTVRPYPSQIGAWASKQSTVLADRKELEDRVIENEARFAGGDVPCPPFWGGFRVAPTRFEFWQGRKSRLHDRICYELQTGEWKVSRLSP